MKPRMPNMRTGLPAALVVVFACLVVTSVLLAHSLGHDAISGVILGGALGGVLGGLIRRRDDL